MDGKEVHKIGLTTKTTEQAIRKITDDFSIVMKVQGALRECWIQKQIILSRFEDKRCISRDRFDGHTDLLALDNHEVNLIVGIMRDFEEQESAVSEEECPEPMTM
jgi:hypothetical protein